MAIQDVSDFTDQVTIEMGSLASKVAPDAFDQCSNKTIAEFQDKWTYPITDPFKAYWFMERGKRHLIQIFLIETAHKFKYKQINLNQRFDHYFKLLEMLDKQFLEAVTENPAAFPEPAGGGVFPDYIANTFTYDFLGQEAA